MNLQNVKNRSSVIPTKAGIQSFQTLIEDLDSGFLRSNDFLRDRQSIELKRSFLRSYSHLGFWILVIVIYLEFGICVLEFPVYPG